MNKSAQIAKFLTTEKVLEYLETELHSAANALGVLRIDSQVWEDESNPRDGFLGYAMQEESGWDNFAVDSGTASEIPETRILVTEFLELMDQIRYSIGMTQLYANTKSDSFFPEESEFFWMHYNNSLIACGIASDRIRDFAIIGVLNKSIRSYGKKLYVEPFKDLEQNLQQRCLGKELGGVTEQLMGQYANDIKDLPAHADEVASLRKKRNSIVHDLSTKSARDLKQRKTQVETQSTMPSVKEMEDRLRKVKASIMENLERNMGELKKWYGLLERMADLVFQAEYMVRKWKETHQS